MLNRLLIVPASDF